VVLIQKDRKEDRNRNYDRGTKVRKGGRMREIKRRVERVIKK
jgi:hypothetical protein